jgi:hypothetical protein
LAYLVSEFLIEKFLFLVKLKIEFLIFNFAFSRKKDFSFAFLISLFGDFFFFFLGFVFVIFLNFSFWRCKKPSFANKNKNDCSSHGSLGNGYRKIYRLLRHLLRTEVLHLQYCFHARTHARTLRRLSRQSNADLFRRVVGEEEEEEEEEDVPASAFLHVRDRESNRDMTAAVMMSSEYHRSIPSSVDSSSSSSHSSSKMSSSTSSSSSSASATTTQPDTAAVRTVMGVMGSWAMSILLNNELRQDIKSKCSERLQLETPGFKVQYAEQAVLANLDWGIEGLESAVKTTNQEARAARLEYSEKMLQVGDQFPHPFSQLA